MFKKTIQVCKTHMGRHLSYRVRVLIWVVCDTLYLVIFPYLWLAIYGNRQSILGYSRSDIITYYIIIGLINLVAHAHIHRIVRLDIMEGTISTHLVRPFNYVYFRALHEITYKAITASIALFLFIVLLWLFPTFVTLPQDWETWALFALSLAGSFFLDLAIQFLISLPSFWMGDTHSITHIRMLLETVFSGVIAPLAFFPHVFQVIANYLPFKYLAYFPAQVYLHQLTTEQILAEFITLGAWIAVAWMGVWVLWKRGVKIYEGVGI